MAIYINRDTKQVRVDDIKQNAIFNRQTNANKAVANLIFIIGRLTTNVNAATNDITILTQLLVNAETGLNACQVEAFNLANVKTKI